MIATTVSALLAAAAALSAPALWTTMPSRLHLTTGVHVASLASPTRTHTSGSSPRMAQACNLQSVEAILPEGVEAGCWQREERAQIIRCELARGAKSDSVAPVLLLNGFGVGSFHWWRNLPTLAKATGANVYGMDYVGQGGSWPVGCNDGNAPSEASLRYAIDDWAEQAIEFIDEIVLGAAGGALAAAPHKCHLVGNSCGGLIAALLAARHPQKIASVSLINPTPVWGSNLPFWDGRLPAPAIPRAIGRFMYDRIRDEGNIASMLKLVYSNPAAVGGRLPAQIRAVTEQSLGGHAAFASIMWSPPATMPTGANSFAELLQLIQCDTLLLYGAQDPWITPEFGRSAARGVRRSAAARAGARLAHVELSPAGHCPHHEVPHAVNAVLARWINGEPVLRDEADGATQSAVQERFVASAADARYFDMDAAHVDVEGKLVDDIEPKSAWELLFTSALR